MKVNARPVALGALFVFVIAFAAFAISRILPPMPYGLADDWRVFDAAAHVAQQGGDPYDAATIHVAEQAAQHYPKVQPSLDDFTDLPTVAVLLRAVSWLPYWSSYVVFTALGVLAAALALAAWMRTSGWNRFGLWLAGALLSWPMLLGFFSGQFDALLLAGTVAALLLLKRDSPWLAGAAMAVVLLKPHLLWPLPLLMFAAWVPHRRQAFRFALAAVLTLAAGTLAGFALVPHSGAFFRHAFGFGGRVSAVQPDLSGLPGLLAPIAHGAPIGIAFGLLGIVVVAATAWMGARRARRTDGTVDPTFVPLLGLALWLACTPYAHPNDDVLLYPLLVVLIGARGRLLDGRHLQLAAMGSLALIAGFVSAAALGYAMLGLAASAGFAQRKRLSAASLAALSLAAIAILPTIWPFHVVVASLTAVAVTLSAIAALRFLGERSGAAVRQPQLSSGHLTGTRVVHSVSS